jgi:hypothetical protein
MLGGDRRVGRFHLIEIMLARGAVSCATRAAVQLGG